MNWRRGLVLAALPLVMSAGVVGAHTALASTASTASAEEPAQTCILGIICLGGGGGSSSSAAPSPTFSLPSCLATPLPSPLPTSLASLPAAILKKLKALPSCLASAAASALPAKLPGLPTSLPTVPLLSGLPTSLPTVPGLPTSVPGLPGSGKGAGSAGDSADPKAKSATDDGLVAPAAISVITASSAQMDHFTYAGNAKLPLAAGGTVTMMKFTASSITLNGAADAVTEAGHTATTSSPVMAFNGDVVLYATKLSGTLDGIPLTFTPTTISGLLLKVANVITSNADITMTSVTTDQATGTADSLTYGPGGSGFSVVLH
jgi:hypothetical protein